MTRLGIPDSRWAISARRGCAAAVALAVSVVAGAGIARAGDAGPPPSDAGPIRATVVPSAPAAPNACPGEFEPNNSAGAALPFDLTTGALNLAICPAGDEDWFSLPMQVGSTYRVETYDIQKVDAIVDTRLYLYSPDLSTLVASNDDRGGSLEGLSSVFTYTPLSAGTYFVKANALPGGAGSENHQYTLRVTDVCNEIYEPDNSSGQAPTLALGRVTMRTLCSGSDEDWARVSLVGGTNYRFETYAGLGAGPDTVLTLFGTDGSSVLKVDDDSGIGSASFMTYTPASTGDYFLRTKAFSAGTSGPGKHYQLLAIASADTVLTITRPCTEAQLDATLALAKPGAGVAFDCATGPGISPFIFPFSAMKYLSPTLTFDGGGAVAFSGLRTNRLFWQLAIYTATFRNVQLVRGGGRLAPGGAQNAGGAILAYGALTFENAELSRNTALTTTYGGGAIYSNGPVTITNSTLSFNTSGGGGALYLDSAARTVVQGGQFVSNTSFGLYGGGITNLGLLTMTGSLMQGNVLSRTTFPAGDEGGGAIANYAAGTVALVNSSLVGNVSARRGGGVQNFGRLSVTGGEVRQNKAILGGGVYNTRYDASDLVAFPGVLSVESTVFQGNAATDSGGGLSQEGTASLRRVRFDANSATLDAGAVWVRGQTTITDSLMTGNSAMRGGAIRSGGSGNLGITSTAFISNSAAQSGGAIVNLSPLFSSRNRFERNTASEGGAISWLGQTTVDRSTFLRNSAGTGGALRSRGIGASLIQVTRSLFEGNTATTSGGALYVDGATSEIVNSTLSGNQAPTGGGMYLGSDSQSAARLTNVSVVDNSASGLHSAISAIAITNTLFSRDLSVAGANCAGASLIRAYNSLSSDITCQLTTVTPAGNNADSDGSLALGPLAWNGGLSKTYLPGPGSSAIDRSPIGPADDQRGAPRAFGLGFDVGAVEVGPVVPNVMPVNVFVPATARDGASGW